MLYSIVWAICGWVVVSGWSRVLRHVTFPTKGWFGNSTRLFWTFGLGSFSTFHNDCAIVWKPPRRPIECSELKLRRKFRKFEYPDIFSTICRSHLQALGSVHRWLRGPQIDIQWSTWIHLSILPPSLYLCSRPWVFAIVLASIAFPRQVVNVEEVMRKLSTKEIKTYPKQQICKVHHNGIRLSIAVTRCSTQWSPALGTVKRHNIPIPRACIFTAQRRNYRYIYSRVWIPYRTLTQTSTTIHLWPREESFTIFTGEVWIQEIYAHKAIWCLLYVFTFWFCTWVTHVKLSLLVASSSIIWQWDFIFFFFNKSADLHYYSLQHHTRHNGPSSSNGRPWLTLLDDAKPVVVCTSSSDREGTSHVLEKRLAMPPGIQPTSNRAKRRVYCKS